MTWFITQPNSAEESDTPHPPMLAETNHKQRHKVSRNTDEAPATTGTSPTATNNTSTNSPLDTHRSINLRQFQT